MAVADGPGGAAGGDDGVGVEGITGISLPCAQRLPRAAQAAGVDQNVDGMASAFGLSGTLIPYCVVT